MCVYIYVLYIYTYIYTHTHIYKYTYIHILTFMYLEQLLCHRLAQVRERLENLADEKDHLIRQ